MRKRLITPADFRRIKEAQANGATIEGYRRQSGRSWDTIKKVFVADTFEQYKGLPPTQHHAGKRTVNAGAVDVLRIEREKLASKLAALDTAIEHLETVKGGQ